MSIEIIQPKDDAEWKKLRTLDITSTEVSALFGASPYNTPFELWHRKRDQAVVDIEANDRMKWGTRLQDAIAAGVAEDEGWMIRKMTEYIRNPDLRIGASFDFSICPHRTDGLGSAVEGKDSEDGLLEIKNVDSLAFRDGWLVDGDHVEAPAHIEFQVQHQLLVSGRMFAYIGALIGGNKVQLIRRERDEKVIEAIREKVREFWKSVDENREPSPDFRRDSGFIASLYSFANPGTTYKGDAESDLGDLVRRYKEFGKAETDAKEMKQAIKAEILMKIGEAEKVKADTFSISAGMIGPKEYTVKSEGYRDFRCFLKKEKAEK